MANAPQIPAKEQIEKRAYELYLPRGGEDGKALDDWLNAELELWLECLETPEHRLFRIIRDRAGQQPGARRAATISRGNNPLGL